MPKMQKLAGQFKILKSGKTRVSGVLELNQVDKFKTRGLAVDLYRKYSAAYRLKVFRFVRYVGVSI